MLTKTVLCADAAGACRLIEVPFKWEHGDPLPAGAIEQWFPTAAAALTEMTARGRAANRVHVASPPPKDAGLRQSRSHISMSGKETESHVRATSP